MTASRPTNRPVYTNTTGHKSGLLSDKPERLLQVATKNNSPMSGLNALRSVTEDQRDVIEIRDSTCCSKAKLKLLMYIKTLRQCY